MSLFSETATYRASIFRKSVVIPALAVIWVSTLSMADAQPPGTSSNHQSRSQAQSVRTPTTTNLVNSTLRDDQTRKADPTNTQGGAPPSEYKK